MKYFKLMVLSLIIIVIALIVYQNQEIFNLQHRFHFDLKVYKTPAYDVPNITVILISFALGVLLSLILGIFHSAGKRSEIKNKNKRIKELEDEISNLESKINESGTKDSTVSVFGTQQN